jgi:hypothetical protein
MRNGKKLAIAVMIKDSPASEEVRERVIAQITKAVERGKRKVGLLTRSVGITIG